MTAAWHPADRTVTASMFGHDIEVVFTPAEWSEVDYSADWYVDGELIADDRPLVRRRNGTWALEWPRALNQYGFTDEQGDRLFQALEAVIKL